MHDRPRDSQREATGAGGPGACRRRRRGVLTNRRAGLVYATIATACLLVGWTVAYPARRPVPLGVLPGEFEHQEALVFSCMLKQPWYDLMAAAAALVHDRIEIIVLVRDADTMPMIRQALANAGVPAERTRMIRAPVRSAWARDFGPLVIKSFDGGFKIVDTEYGVSRADAGHDEVPSHVASSLKLPLVRAPLVMENGNLLSNGGGLCVTTEKIVQANGSRSSVTAKLKQYFGATQVVYLEPLAGEINGHVDMFATFTAPDTIVVGEYSPAADPVNAAILDRNAKRLAAVRTASGPLRVHRIPMPERIKGLWMTHTNVVYANGVLLFPTCGDFDAATREQAKAVYRRLLPQWRIAEIDCTEFIINGGAIHCMALNLYRAPSRAADD